MEAFQVKLVAARTTQRGAEKRIGRNDSTRSRCQMTDAAKKLHADWWQQRVVRQKDIDASIAAKAEFEFLYETNPTRTRKVRVAGPFTVESLSPHRVLGQTRKTT